MPRKLKVRFKELLPYLEHTPLMAYPFLPVKQMGPAHGAWSFPLGPHRAFPKVDGQTVWIGKVWRRPTAHDKTHLRQLGRSLHL